jgi:hypothetical protein
MDTKKVKFIVNTLKSTYPNVTYSQIVNAIVKWFTERCHQAYIFLSEEPMLQNIVARAISLDCDTENIILEVTPIGRFSEIGTLADVFIGGSWIINPTNNEIELSTCYVL